MTRPDTTTTPAALDAEGGRKGPEAKVIAGAGGAAAGGVVAALVLYLLDIFVFTSTSTAGDQVPEVVVAAAMLVFGGGGSWLAGWAAPHTPRVSAASAVAAARSAAKTGAQLSAAMEQMTALSKELLGPPPQTYELGGPIAPTVGKTLAEGPLLPAVEGGPERIGDPVTDDRMP